MISRGSSPRLLCSGSGTSFPRTSATAKILTGSAVPPLKSADWEPSSHNLKTVKRSHLIISWGDKSSGLRPSSLQDSARAARKSFCWLGGVLMERLLVGVGLPLSFRPCVGLRLLRSLFPQDLHWGKPRWRRRHRALG